MVGSGFLVPLFGGASACVDNLITLNIFFSSMQGFPNPVRIKILHCITNVNLKKS